jgi:hypothetical protein
LYNQDSTAPSITPSDYSWYLADPAFGTSIYLAYINYSNRKFAFDTDFATKILEDATYDNFLGDTATYHTADVSSIQQARTFLDLGNKA